MVFLLPALNGHKTCNMSTIREDMTARDSERAVGPPKREREREREGEKGRERERERERERG